MIDYTVVTSLSTTAALTRSNAITVTATLFPIGDGLNNDDPTRLGLPRDDQGYPTFASDEIGPITVVQVAKKVPGQVVMD